MISKVVLGDCMNVLPKFPDNFFDLAVVDPPYFSGPEKRKYYGRSVSPIGVQRVYEQCEEWEIPTKEYFDELFRVSKNQIIWGINYFEVGRHIGSGRIVWDKCNGASSFSDCEIAYCSMINSVRLFPLMWNGMFQAKSISEGRTQQGNKKLNEKRIHPTQKPVMLYDWIFQKFAQPGQKIIDTHLGSGSSRISAYKSGLDFYGIEKDKSVLEKSNKRFADFMKGVVTND